jgi:predicted PurR-regulated permease PerM
MADLTTKKVFRFLIYAAGIIAAFYFLFLLSDVILIVAISILLSFIFDPFVKLLEREGLKRFPSTLIVFIGFGFLIYLFFSIIIPNFVYQVNQLKETLHVYSLREQLNSIDQQIYNLIPFFNQGELADKLEKFFSEMILNSFERMSDLVSSVISVVAMLVIVPFITFFLLKDSRHLLKSIIHVVPNKYFEMSYWILKKVSIQLGRYVRAWIFDASFVGITCGLGFYLIGIDNALPLGVIAGLGHLVPYFGPVIGGIPAIIISVLQYGGFSHVPFIILLLIFVYMLDNGFFQPYVFSKSVDMHPIVIILLIIAGSQLFGLIGMLLAIPTATVIKTATKEIYFAFKNYKIARM